MSKTEAQERAEVQSKFKRNAEREGLCTAFKVFDLGGNGTVYVGCGKPVGHHEPFDDEQSADPYAMFHQTQRKEDDGSVVVFRWPV